MNHTFQLQKIASTKIARNPSYAGRYIVEVLKQDRALLIQVPDYDVIYDKALKFAKAFFSLPEEEKEFARGVDAFKRTHSNLNLDAEFLGKLYSRPTADVYGKERGWVPVGRSNTRVQKEYFQYGLELAPFEQPRESLIPNVWPTREFGWDFKKAKLDHLSLLTSIHLAIFRALSCFFFSGQLDRFHVWPANILCRDTHYLPCATNDAVVGQPWNNSLVRNPPHVDLGEGTLIKVEKGLEIYIGDYTDRDDIANTEEGWTLVDESTCGSDDLLYIPGLAMEIRSGGLLRGTWHRVIGGDAKSVRDSRYSIVSFGNAGVTDFLSPCESIEDVSGLHRYTPIRRDHLPILGNKAYIDAISSNV